MKLFLITSILSFSLGALAAFDDEDDYNGGRWPRGRVVSVSVRGQSYYPDQMTADAVCRFNGYYRSTGYTLWRQAGNRIQGQRSYDGSPRFNVEIWGGGMALDLVNCMSEERRERVSINVQGQGYYPDQLTADAVCRLNGYGYSVGLNLWKQAGDRIQGLRSYDGRPYFQSEVWGGGMALAIVVCELD